MKGIHKDTKTFFNKEKFIRKDLFDDLNWLENKDVFHQKYLKILLIGNINNSNKKEIYKNRLDGVENGLTKSKKSKNVNQLKDYLTKIKDLTGIKDRIKADEVRSFKDQKGKGYVNLPIALSKMYTNNNSKELKANIKNSLNHLYDNKQITKQVYNILNKAITYKDDL